ncbi:TIGR00730 family Rossman fold protein [Parvularcula dongshanensis]|uniref:Cytokinin riboside 5'-monophosphate phosphoribohydrolase n=1 Tax=Parvularcula dongshanensis TaxID=1173995 RepID=A0A840I450_9PROT|nr:TIGR00730 family Rossman fold protein [Parvularcula dongshanensis]MBB4659547.1 hypothetical protein [Parvularcula dongshanensis]
MSKLSSLCVYCGSRNGDSPVFAEAARTLGRACAENGTKLVYGGGALGLMGETAGAARDAGGEVFGVIPGFLVELEGVLEGVDHEVVDTMHTRKMMMFEQADAFCTLPGGIGTLEEVIELLSWARLELHRKPIVILDIEGFWTPLVDLIDHVIERGFAAEELRQDIIVVNRAEDVLPAIEERLFGNVV